MPPKKRKPTSKSAPTPRKPLRVPAKPPPDNPLLRQQGTEPSPERAKEMAQARLDALKKLGLIKE